MGEKTIEPMNPEALTDFNVVDRGFGEGSQIGKRGRRRTIRSSPGTDSPGHKQ
jgi:hypothetical protein